MRPALVTALCCALVAAALAGKPGPAPAGRPPHVVVFLVDDLGAADLAPWAVNDYIQSPFIKKVVQEEATVMTQAYVACICSPTRSELMSGRYRIHTGLQHGVIRPSQPNALPLNDTIIPTFLKRASPPYSTYMTGKWHLGFYKEEYVPTSRSFDKYTGYYIGAEDYYTHDRSFDGFSGYDMRNGTDVDRGANGTYSSDLFAERAVEYINGHADEHGNDKPLFLYVPLQNVHGPLQAPPGGLINRFKDIGDVSRRTLASMVLAADIAVGNITTAMYESGLASPDSPTVFFLFSDNNGIKPGGFNWPLRGEKATLWEGGMRTHYLVWGTHPDLKGGPKTYDGMFHVTDMLPTIVEGLAGVKVDASAKLDGFNQWDYIVGRQSGSPRTEMMHNIDPISNRAAIRVGDMKFMLGNVGNANGWFIPPEWTPPKNETPPNPGPAPKDDFVGLYNITADPLERHNLAESMPDMVRKLRQRMDEWNATSVPCRYPAMDPNSNPKLHGGAWGPWMK